MKKYFNIFLLALVALTSVTMVSCKNETEEIFDQDAITRLENAKDNYINILTDQGGKWQMEYYANGDEPGYIYLMTFRDDGSVTISGENIWIGKVQGESRDIPVYGSQTSLWDVITDNGPVLTFNSFNKFFHLFADPEDIPSMSDEDTDETGYGHEGDYEFDLMKYSGDTLYISGKKYGIDMIMTRVNADIDDHVYMDEVIAMADSFFNAKIPQVYMNLPNGTRWIIKNGASSILKMFREGDDEISTAETHNVIITHDGLSFMNPLTFDGYTVQHFIRQADGSLLCRNDNETTITADDLNVVLGTFGSLVWNVDTVQTGGVIKSQLQAIRKGLDDWGSSRKLLSVKISYDPASDCHSLIFGCSFKDKGKVKSISPTFYMKAELVGDDQIKFHMTGEADEAGVNYRTNCPAFNNLLDYFNGATFRLTTPSLLAPVDMMCTDTNNGANYFFCTCR